MSSEGYTCKQTMLFALHLLYGHLSFPALLSPHYMYYYYHHPFSLYPSIHYFSILAPVLEIPFVFECVMLTPRILALCHL